MMQSSDKRFVAISHVAALRFCGHSQANVHLIFEWLQPKEWQHCNKTNTSPGVLFFRHLRLLAINHPRTAERKGRPSTDQPRLPFLHFLRRHGGLGWLIVVVGLFLAREQIPVIKQYPVPRIKNFIMVFRLWDVYSAKVVQASFNQHLWDSESYLNNTSLPATFCASLRLPDIFIRTIPIFLKSSSVDEPVQIRFKRTLSQQVPRFCLGDQVFSLASQHTNLKQKMRPKYQRAQQISSIFCEKQKSRSYQHLEHPPKMA